MRRDEIAAARLKVAIAAREGREVSPEIQKLAETPLSLADEIAPEVCSRCRHRAGTTTDRHGDGKPKCSMCMDELEEARYWAEHGG